MILKFEQFVSQQRKKMIFMLLAYIFTGVVAISLMVKLTAHISILLSMVMSVSVALGVGWILTKMVNHLIPVSCPNCSSSMLTENFTLQCKMPEYQCDQCQKVYR